MNPAELFASNLALIDRVIATVCRRAHLYGADAEDFASHVKLMLIDNDYDVLRRYEGRSSLAGYLAIVVQRLLFDQRTHAHGRWHASREAERLGDAAVMLETLVRRDGRSLDEALPLMRSADPAMTRDRLAEIAARLPERVRRPRVVALEDDAPIAAAEAADDRVVASDVRRASDLTSRVIREALAKMEEEDRMIIRFRYGSSMSIADISRMLRLPQRPLYRRIESLLQRLRNALAAAGVEARDVGDLIDFGLDDWEIAEPRQFSSLENR